MPDPTAAAPLEYFSLPQPVHPSYYNVGYNPDGDPIPYQYPYQVNHHIPQDGLDAAVQTYDDVKEGRTDAAAGMCASRSRARTVTAEIAPPELPPVDGRQEGIHVSNAYLWRSPFQRQGHPEVYCQGNNVEGDYGLSAAQQDQALLQPELKHPLDAPQYHLNDGLVPPPTWSPYAVSPGLGLPHSALDHSYRYLLQNNAPFTPFNPGAAVNHTSLSPRFAASWDAARQGSASQDHVVDTSGMSSPIKTGLSHSGPIRTVSSSPYSRKRSSGRLDHLPALHSASPYYSVRKAGRAEPNELSAQIPGVGGSQTWVTCPSSSALSASQAQYNILLIDDSRQPNPMRILNGRTAAGACSALPIADQGVHRASLQRIHPAPSAAYPSISLAHGHIRGSPGGVDFDIDHRHGPYGSYHALPVEEAKPSRFKPSKEQLAILIESYNQNKNPDAATREALARRLGPDIKPKTLQIWFQNRRSKSRAKEREAALSRQLSLDLKNDSGGRKESSGSVSSSGLDNKRNSVTDVATLRAIVHDDDVNLHIIPVSVLSISTWTRFLTPGFSASPDLAVAVRLSPELPNAMMVVEPEMTVYVVHSGHSYRISIPLHTESVRDIEAAANARLNADALLMKFELKKSVCSFAGWNQEAKEWRSTGDFSGGVVAGGGRVEITGQSDILFNAPLPTPITLSHNHLGSSALSSTAFSSPVSPSTPTPTAIASSYTDSPSDDQEQMGQIGGRNSAAFAPGWRFPAPALTAMSANSADNTPIEPCGLPPHLRPGGTQGVHQRAGRARMGHMKQRSLSAPIAKPVEFEAATLTLSRHPNQPSSSGRFNSALMPIAAHSFAMQGTRSATPFVPPISLTQTIAASSKVDMEIPSSAEFNFDLLDGSQIVLTPPFVLDDALQGQGASPEDD